MFSSITKIGLTLLLLTTGGAADTFTIHGRVTDSHGAIVPNVAIRAINTTIRLPRGTVTDPAGTYSLPRLIAGQYVVTADALGFSVGGKQLDLKAGANMTLDFSLTPATAPAPPQATAAERVVERMWDVSMQMPGPGKPAPSDPRQRDIIKQLHQLGKDAIPALALALKDPDAQMRSNAALVLVDLSGGLSEEARPKLDLHDALPALNQALTDSEPDVKAWAGQAIKQIQSKGQD